MYDIKDEDIGTDMDSSQPSSTAVASLDTQLPTIELLKVCMFLLHICISYMYVFFLFGTCIYIFMIINLSLVNFF